MTTKDWITKKPCTITGCKEKRVYKKYCRTHYRKYRTYKVCSIDECSRNVTSFGLCNAHRRREQRYGSPLAGYSFRHGQSKTLAYGSWVAAKERTNSPRAKDYSHYGGRGIVMCEGWSNSSKKFIDDMGERPSRAYSLDRIDNGGNYSCGNCEECVVNNWPMNCRWATRTEQQKNKSNVHRPTSDKKAFYVDGKRVRNNYPEENQDKDIKSFLKKWCPELNPAQVTLKKKRISND